MNPVAIFALLAGSALLGYYVLGQSGLSPGADIMAAVEGWQNVGEGPTWLPLINQTESSLGIPPDLLARMAFQESSFSASVITGEQPSSAGALGILQLMPSEFSSVQVPVPFSASDTQAQITQAGQYLLQLYGQFADWGVAVAAYNAGPTRMSEVLAGTATLPAETADYVADILADVPQQTQLTA